MAGEGLPQHGHAHLVTAGLAVVLLAQFLATLADNAVLFVAIALLRQGHAPEWQVPILQEFFVAAFILLAPFVGPWTDAQPKGRVLLQGALLRLVGALALALGQDAFFSFAMIGLGAAWSSAAKSGILGELCRPGTLVAANGALEASQVLALLLGAVAGAHFADVAPASTPYGIGLIYALSAASCLAIPRLLPARPVHFPVIALAGRFLRMLTTLLADPLTRSALLGTALFWGCAAALRFVLIAWIPMALGRSDLTDAGYLTAATGAGVALGALFAARFVRIEAAPRVWYFGLAMACVVAAFAWIHGTGLAVLALMLTGLFGGVFLVTFNAVLQHFGATRVGSGGAIAVQNLLDNLGMLALVGCYLEGARRGLRPADAALLVAAVLGVASCFLGLQYRAAVLALARREALL